MKQKLIFILLLALVSQLSFGQTEENPPNTSECSGFNAFLDGSLEGLMYYASSISRSGLVEFDLTKSSELGGIESLHPLLGVQSGSTFTLVNTTPSRWNPDLQHYKYQQYHHGLKVVGGGYTVSALATNPGDPCAALYALAPNIYSGINVSTSSTITAGSLGSILQSDGEVNSELVIALNLLGNCQYRLVWEAKYQNDGAKISWVDAQTGAVLQTADAFAHNLAPTVNYGMPNLDDSVVGGERTLISEDGIVRTAPGWPLSAADFNGLVIPTNPDINANWTTAQAARGLYQSHFVTTSVLPAFSDVGIDFESVNVAFHQDANIGVCYDDFDQTSVRAYLLYGTRGGTYDIAGHELGHAYILNYISYSNFGNKIIHEALADMIAAYAESKVQGYTDWISGDDDPDLYDSDDNVDMQNPQSNCWSGPPYQPVWPEQYYYGGPMRRWFFLMVEGDAANGINGIGMDNAIKVALEALNYLDGNDDVDEFAEATALAAYLQFGPCSAEAATLRAAWAQVCVNLSVNCDFTIYGPPAVCEEDDYMTLSITGGPGPTAEYLWHFPSDWTVPGSQANTFQGPVLYVTDFPKYSWYPRNFTIKARLLNGGSEQKHKVKLMDCNDDDPTCADVYELSGENSGAKSATLDKTALLGDAVVNEIARVKVFDLTGKLLFDGSIEELTQKRLNYTGLLVFAYFDANNHFVKAEKTTIIR